MKQSFQKLLVAQKKFFDTGATRPLTARKKALRDLMVAVKKNEERIIAALWQDLHKSSTASFVSEISQIYQEIRFVEERLDLWYRPQPVKVPFFLPWSKSVIEHEPAGVVLIITPFNVPFLGPLSVLSGSIAAGNCAILKVSEASRASAAVLLDIIEEAFPKEFVTALVSNREESEVLLELPFDHIFFMGSSETGTAIMEKASHNLTPLTLQLGGKCPAIADERVNLDALAKRVTWGKFTNAGQECVAIDHLYLPTSRVEGFISAMKKSIKSFYGTNPKESIDFERIVSDQHFKRLTRLLTAGRIRIGGETAGEERYIAPTVVDKLPLDSPLLHEEIFGPILPIIPYDRLDTVLAEIQARPHPLAVYVFSPQPDFQEIVREHTRSGSLCINDSMVQNVLNALPIGGIGMSGFGRIHGQYTFLEFSRTRAIVKRPLTLDLPGRYPPSQPKLLPFIKRILG